MSIKTTVKYKNGETEIKRDVLPLFNLDDETKSFNWSDLSFNIENTDDTPLVEDVESIVIEFIE